MDHLLESNGFAHGTAFARATNQNDLGHVGDPERWGGSVMLTRSNQDEGAATISDQFIRAQCKGLAARGWDLWCRWSVTNWEHAKDTLNLLALEITVGAGMSSASGLVSLTGGSSYSPASAAPGSFIVQNPVSVDNPSGVIQAVQAIPASALAVRLVFNANKKQGGNAPKLYTVQATVTVAPRALPW